MSDIVGVLSQPTPIVGVTSDGSALATVQAMLAADQVVLATVQALFNRIYLLGGSTTSLVS